MATTISIKKGAIQLVTVAITYGISIGAATLAKSVGVELTADQQGQLIIAATATLTGLVTAGLNWWKHRKTCGKD
jgi:hypothetical protein